MLYVYNLMTGNTHLFELAGEDLFEFVDDAVEVGDDDHLGAVLAEVDEGGGPVRLDPGVVVVVHHIQQLRHDLQQNAHRYTRRTQHIVSTVIWRNTYG